MKQILNVLLILLMFSYNAHGMFASCEGESLCDVPISETQHPLVRRATLVRNQFVESLKRDEELLTSNLRIIAEEIPEELARVKEETLQWLRTDMSHFKALYREASPELDSLRTYSALAALASTHSRNPGIIESAESLIRPLDLKTGRLQKPAQHRQIGVLKTALFYYIRTALELYPNILSPLLLNIFPSAEKINLPRTEEADPLKGSALFHKDQLHYFGTYLEESESSFLDATGFLASVLGVPNFSYEMACDAWYILTKQSSTEDTETFVDVFGAEFLRRFRGLKKVEDLKEGDLVLLSPQEMCIVARPIDSSSFIGIGAYSSPYTEIIASGTLFEGIGFREVSMIKGQEICLFRERT